MLAIGLSATRANIQGSRTTPGAMDVFASGRTIDEGSLAPYALPAGKAGIGLRGSSVVIRRSATEDPRRRPALRVGLQGAVRGGRAGAGTELDLPRTGLVAAALAVPIRADIAPAAGMEGESGRPV